jgi:hypothetical protein
MPCGYLRRPKILQSACPEVWDHLMPEKLAVPLPGLGRQRRIAGEPFREIGADRQLGGRDVHAPISVAEQAAQR